jgi:hypothetical protein
VHWITGLLFFACTLSLLFVQVHARLTLLLRAIDLQINAVEKLHGNSLWTRTFEGTKDADKVLFYLCVQFLSLPAHQPQPQQVTQRVEMAMAALTAAAAGARATGTFFFSFLYYLFFITLMFILG